MHHLRLEFVGSPLAGTRLPRPRVRKYLSVVVEAVNTDSAFLTQATT